MPLYLIIFILQLFLPLICYIIALDDILLSNNGTDNCVSPKIDLAFYPYFYGTDKKYCV